jgi:ubiquinone biosynthesis monooxygenase Coq7
MLHGEVAHSATMDELVISRRARPSLALPVANVVGFALGAASGLLGSQAAMACTVAVETVIGGHYNSQIRELLAHGYTDEHELLAILKKHRDDELEHLNTSLENGAEQLPFYAAFTGFIKAGCTVAIEIAKRV